MRTTTTEQQRTTKRHNFKTGLVLEYRCDFCGEMETHANHQTDKNQVEHTPLPWSVANNWIMKRHPTADVRVAVCDAYTAPKQTSDPRDRANAALIVKAVNNYTALVAALEQLKDYAAGLELLLSVNQIEFNSTDQIAAASGALARARE